MRRAPVAVAAVVATLAGCTSGAPPHVQRVASAPHRDVPVAMVERNRHGGGWRLHTAAGAHGLIEGYADRVSVQPGARVRLFVSTTARAFVVRAFRMGWYDATGGRLVWSSSPQRGVRQSPPHVIRATNTAQALWSPSTVVDTTGWLPGDYLLRLDASSGAQSYVPLTVRGPTARGAVVLISPVTTWQAYNRWGCCNLYTGINGGFDGRARAVSFDRPYDAENGAGEFIERTLPVLAQAERLGLRLDYVTDLDLQQVPGLLDGARAVISMGHDEYWSAAMRAAVTAARDRGTNIAFFGANAVYRRIRLEPSRLGPARVEVDYKIAAEDPMTARHPAQTTADWPAPPHANPESSLTGAMYDCFPIKTGAVVVDPAGWLFAGTGVTRGTRLPGLIGPETDRVQLNYPTPRPIEVLLHTPFYCPRGWRSFADTTYYTAPSGAGVFDAGTIDWACDISGGCRATRFTARVVRRVTDNLLLVFSRGPAGGIEPAHDNLAALRITRG